MKSPADSDEKWLYCESEAKAAVAAQMKLSFQTRFEEELKKMTASLLKPRGWKKYGKVMERIGRLKEKHRRIARCYEINVVASEDGKTATAIKWAPIEEKLSDKLTGSYFLRTNLIHLRLSCTALPSLITPTHSNDTLLTPHEAAGVQKSPNSSIGVEVSHINSQKNQTPIHHLSQNHWIELITLRKNRIFGEASYPSRNETFLAP